MLHQAKAEKTRKLREHGVSSEEFFAPGTRTAAGDLKPRWFKDIPEDDSDCTDYWSDGRHAHEEFKTAVRKGSEERAVGIPNVYKNFKELKDEILFIQESLQTVLEGP